MASATTKTSSKMTMPIRTSTRVENPNRLPQGAPAGPVLRLAGDHVPSCLQERHTAASQSRVVVSAVIWDDLVVVREGRRCSAHHRCPAASRHRTDRPLARLPRFPGGSAHRGGEESTVLLRPPAAGPRTVPGDPATAHRPDTAADHPPRRTRRGDAQPAALGGAGHPDGYRPGARSQPIRVPAPLLNTACRRPGRYLYSPRACCRQPDPAPRSAFER